MNKDNIFSVITSLLVVALVTTLVLPGRQTNAILGTGTNGLAKNIKTAIGQG
jgi:hypothetical protein